MDVYNKMYDTYHTNETSIFDTVLIKIYYIYDYRHIVDTKQRGYILKRIQIIDENGRLSLLKQDIDDINEQLPLWSDNKGWQLFYLYKELIQRIGYNYYRGQSSSHTPWPVILRDNQFGTSRLYRTNFEHHYRTFTKLYPERLTYIPIHNKDKSYIEREAQLSILQHYGLGTSLLDITSNPFIAMLFMMSSQIDRYTEPTLFMFSIPESVNEENHLFSTVNKSKHNTRINAQQGAFLNFDKLIKTYETDSGEEQIEWRNIEPLPVVKVQLCFDEELYNDSIQQYIADTRQSLYQTQNPDARKRIEQLLLPYEDALDRTAELKLECLRCIQSDIIRKLMEFGYEEKQLYPDFEKQLEFTMKQYKSKDTTHSKFKP